MLTYTYIHDHIHLNVRMDEFESEQSVVCLADTIASPVADRSVGF